MNLEYPRWQKSLQAAILEFNPPQLREKLKCAEEAIYSRIQELRLGADRGHEVRLLFDGLSIIRVLKRDRLDPPERRNVSS